MIINSQKRSFGKGPKVSLFTLGTMRATDDFDKMYEIIKQAYFSGINHIETAATYGNAEILIGKALEKLENLENIPINQWIITTKVLPKGDLDQLKKNLKRSLHNLKRSKINNLAIHGINLNEHLDWAITGEGKDFLKWVIEIGLVDQIGFSSHGNYSLIKETINSNIFNFCNLHLHFLDQSKLALAELALKKIWVS